MSLYSELFKALSDETRLSILSLLLYQGELCVCDIEGVLEISQSKASRHLRYLKNLNILEDRRKGIWVYYKIIENPNEEVKVILNSNKTLLLSQLNKTLIEKLQIWIKTKSETNKCLLNGKNNNGN
jgi:ArsR family transcriptional regulator, arsenate/arsenite/antimonite-responsive transcriptional repressor